MTATAGRRDSIRTILAPNPGPMTLDGTNTYVIRVAGAADAVVVDPGPLDAEHLGRIEADGPVGLILLTHHHGDHTEAAVELARRTGAPVRAWQPGLCVDAPALRDGERLTAGGASIEVLHTPGHTEDSVCLSVTVPGEAEVVLTGDTILGRGTTIIAPGGGLGWYLHSLELLRDRGDGIRALPAHGPELPDLAVVARAYLDHRRARLAEITDVLADLGLPASADDGTVDAVADRLYGGLPADLRGAGRASAAAQLAYLAEPPLR